MTFVFECPNCHYKITDVDFKQDERILSSLKTIFDNHKDEYIKNIKSELVAEINKQQTTEFDKKLAIKENEFNLKIQEEKDKLNKIINDQLIELNNNKNNLKLLENEIQISITKEKQKEIDALKENIASLNSIIKNNELESQKLVAEKINELNILKQKELDELNNKLTAQTIELSNSKSTLQSILDKKVLEITNNKQKEIDNLKEEIKKLEILVQNNKSELNSTVLKKENELQKIITELKAELSNSNNLLEKEIAKKEAEFIKKLQEETAKYQNEININNKQIKELEMANMANKVIQNKIKGENFEHDVYGELLKVFEDDKVIKITSQDKKADYLQEVILDNKTIGKIVYEVKNAEWSNVWEKKLIEDMAKQGSKYGILVATSFNKKYPGIPFKKSDISQNIYICDADSFIFIGQIIRSIIKLEHKFEMQKNITDYDEKIKGFNSWKEVHLPKLLKICEDSFERIKDSEQSIIKKVDEIRIAREKMQNNALHNIRVYIEELNF
ncbi:DUF2130 domain-containing protein [Spiroplasma turonicum]|uniref:Putative chromosome segregation ATPase n=1 Tax=Spiroplasma turonicum TaxID=216946 RepID=A0A0K1P721_9MOLU|nr:DUF2130 domain-containing protein [Spiroplasma turonicum]AKU79989.1 putative chromosome segregation ATPase [Spiroplasma turonicum]ALX70991.1 hypothetical protein STURO_v1c07400 [Spiroplasma turonicum]